MRSMIATGIAAVFWSLSFAATAALAQDSLLPSATRGDLTPDQARTLQIIEGQPSSRRTDIVTVTDEFLSRLTTNQQIQLRPFNDVVVSLRGAADIAPSTVAQSRFAWSGTAASNSSNFGAARAPSDAAFFVNGTSVTGTMDLGDKFYELRPLAGRTHVLIEVDRARLPQEHPPSFRDRQRQLRDKPPIDAKDLSDARTSEIRVLVAYTNQVPPENVAGISGLAIQQANISYRTSDVRIRLIGAGDPIHLNYDESGSYEVDVDALRLRNDGKMDEIHSIRDERRADVVILLVQNASYAGLAADIEASGETAFAAVNYLYATRFYSFTHEIGHLQGARHNPEEDSTPGYAHGYTDDVRRRRSIMGYPCPSDPNCPRELQWARPPEWGNPTHSHDARRINETADHVASFR